MRVIPSVPLLGDPLRRVPVPRALDEVTTVAAEAPPEAVGLDAGKIERIWKAACDLYRSGVHPALVLCLRRHGQVVLDRALGHARGNGPRDGADADKLLATPQTPFCIFSASKAVTAIVVHMLAERGVFDIHDRVADYIPEYARHGKATTTIAHVLAHRAGVPGIPEEAIDLDRVNDREFLTDIICNAKPLVAPGSLLAYHAVSGGVILAEVVRRAAGRELEDILYEEILAPLHFRWGNYGVPASDVGAVGLNYLTGPPLLPPLSTLVKRVLGTSLDRVVELSNDPRFLTAVLPSANVVTTANELSRFFELLRAGGELDGVRVLQASTLRYALSEQSRLEIDLSLLFPTRFSFGLMLGSQVISLFGRDTDHVFGHLGLINIMGWADPERGLAAGLITSGKAIVYPEVYRFYGVMQRIAAEVPKVPADERPF